MITLVDNDLPREWLLWARKIGMVGLDIETSGLDIATDRLATVQIYVPVYGSVMIRNFYETPVNLIALMEDNVTKIIHHAPFDLSFLMRDFPIMMPKAIADTKLAAKILDPRKELFIDATGKGSHSLKVLIKHVFNIELDKTHAVSDWFGELSPAQLAYAENDVKYLPELLAWFMQRLSNRDIDTLLHIFDYLPTHVMLKLKYGQNDIFGYS